ncbi:MAG: Rieske (2Fe-2S) protein [Bacteroidetes bacterium]|nr:Rieske (2Fe-2S) protein [Bacteroidota bacterium]
MNTKEKYENNLLTPLESKLKNSRRIFLKLLFDGSIMAAIGFIVYPIISYLIPPKTTEPTPSSVLVAKLGELKPNSGKIFRFGNKPGILINTPNGELKAFTAVCTHLSCTVQYREDLKHIWCACHNGHYDLNGINISGPPPRPLTEFKVNIKGDQVYVSKGIQDV